MVGALGQYTEFFAKDRASSGYIHLFDLTLTFFTNLHERYSFSHYLKKNSTFRVKALPQELKVLQSKSQIFLSFQVVKEAISFLYF